MKLYLTPLPEQVTSDNGVGRVVLAQHKYLPEFGVELVRSEAEADITASHIWAEHVQNLDVLHTHGLYYTADQQFGPYGEVHHLTNQRIMAAARRARFITTPAEWSAEPFRRDMRIRPVVIPNGVETELWRSDPKAPKPTAEFVLWNKNRTTDAVCDPGPAYELASRGIPVVTTFGPDGRLPLPTLQVTGRVPFETMQTIVKQAGFYLATTKEVFSLSVLEAMAAGVPILGYRWGGTAEAVQHQVEGYLVEPGDIEGLLKGLDWLRANRKRVSQACRKKAKHYEWRNIIEQYAALYRDAWEQKQHERHSVTVVIPCYNYGRYLKEAVESVQAQTVPPTEIIVVDDGSTDNTPEVAKALKGIQYIRQDNAGVAVARNRAIEATESDYIVCLDADDRLDPRYIETLLPAFKQDRALGVAWTKLRQMNPDGSLTDTLWDFDFSWEQQADFTDGKIKNGIPSGAMFRREMWARAGGYKQVYHPAEDAEFWTRGLACGFTARRVSDEGLFHYRWHEGSASRTLKAPAIHTWHTWSLDHQYPMAAPARTQPLINSYSDPLVTVVIPVGPGHTRFLPAALDSLLGQTFRRWEAIVVDDTYDNWELLQTLYPYPFVRKVQSAVGSVTAVGAGKARNAGLKEAKAPLVLWLDADDFLVPNALEQMVRAKQQHGLDSACYIYSDWVRLEGDGKAFDHQTPEYSAEAWLERGQHAVTTLMRTQDARAIGGFDETLIGWEDWDFYIKTALRGICGHRVPEKLLVYRIATGKRREDSLANRDELLRVIRERYKEAKPVACGCGNQGVTLTPASQELLVAQMQASGVQVNQNGKVVMEFTGDQQGAVVYRVNGRLYSGGNNPFDRYAEVDPADVARLQAYGVWRVAQGQLAQAG